MALSLTKLDNNEYSVGSFDAKTYFAELLRKVQEGAVINITKNGKNVAVLQDKKQMQNCKAISAWKELCSIGNEVNAKAVSNGNAGLTVQDIQELKNNGRKY